MQKFLALVLIPLMLLSGCGGGGGGGSAPPPSTPTVATTSLAEGVVNQPYGATLAATGGTAPYTWSVSSGTLPGGLTLNATSGYISGTPSAAASATPLTVTVTDSASKTGTANLALTIIAAPPAQTIAGVGPNVVPLVVDSGPAGLTLTAVNIAYLMVTVCIPGNVPPSANCQNIDHVEVDTGSNGLRILADAPFNLTLPSAKDSNNNPLAECLKFADGASWGPIGTADVYISGEKALGISVHVIGGASGTIGGTVPSGCDTPAVLKTENTVADFGANGILGVGPFINDCNSGGTCTAPPMGSPQSATYYGCPSVSNCATTDATLAQQVPNTVVHFATDNNGVIVELPPVSGATQVNPAGALVFGIGTQANNALGSATKLPGDANGNITAVFAGSNYGAFLDSGSNANFFPSSLTVCPSPNDGFYCPSALTSESAKLQGTGTGSESADFNVDNANTLFSTNPTYTAFPDLAGPIPAKVNPPFFDLGLSFFFGRNVFTGFENPGTNAAPYYAY